MKIATILGTRPEIIRLSLIMKKLDQFASKHTLVHTGQNFTHTLSSIFFQQMGLREPDYLISGQQQSLGAQLSQMFAAVEEVLLAEKPDKVLILGDTNSALTAVLAERLGFPVVHMEAGNRCFDLSVPEEKNRKVIDAVSSINMPYTKESKENLLREGVPVERIVTTGNPIYEVLQHYSPEIQRSKILKQLGLSPKEYFLATIHRAENVDDPERLEQIIKGLNLVAEVFKTRIVASIHPRTKSRLEQSPPAVLHPAIEFHEPFGFFDFALLEKNAWCVLTDSGTVQEECCIFQVPTVTVRNSTERPETVDCGSNIVSGTQAEQILGAAQIMITQHSRWNCPEGYMEDNVSDKVMKFLLGGKGIVC